MANKIKEIIIAFITAIVTWLALSYIFFPIKFSAPVDEYFVATMGHMVPLKILITIIFTLAAIVIYERIVNKSKND